MFSSIPFLFVYPYMPLLICFYLRTWNVSIVVCVRHLFRFISGVSLLPQTSSILQH